MSARLHDCLVVGAGPAGATLARYLAEQGKEVLLFDSRQFPRWKPCGGAVRESLESTLGFSLAKVIEAEIKEARLSYEGERPFRIFPDHDSFPLVNRDRFDALLLKKAVEAGARLISPCRIVSVLEKPGEVWAFDGQGEKYRGRFLAGTDGANSIVRKAEGFASKGRRGFTVTARLKAPDIDSSKVIFDFGRSAGGYAWIFPKRSFYDVGITGISWDGPELIRNLRCFLKEHGFKETVEEDIFRGYPIPYFYGLRKLNTQRILLAGDAASLVDPLTGEGIEYAVRSAVTASQAVLEALDQEGGGRVVGYQDRIHHTIGRELTAALGMARYYRTYPALCYNVCRKSERVQEAFIRFLSGRLNYLDGYKALRRSLPIRILFSLLWVKKAFRRRPALKKNQT